MTTAQTGPAEPAEAADRDVVAALLAALVEPLLDARATPAARRFDELTAAAVLAGQLTPELAHQLRFWQRTSVHEVADHIRTVLPVVLPVALTATAAAAADARAAVEAADLVWQERAIESFAAGASVPPIAAEVHAARIAAEPEAVVSAEDPPAAPDAPDDGPADHSSTDHSSADDSPADDEVDRADQDLPSTASPHHRRRLFVAGLTSTA